MPQVTFYLGKQTLQQLMGWWAVTKVHAKCCQNQGAEPFVPPGEGGGRLGEATRNTTHTKI